MDWILSAGSLLATWMIGSGHRWGWLASAGVLVIWCIYFFHTGQYGLLTSDVLFIAISIRNYIVLKPSVAPVEPPGGPE